MSNELGVEQYLPLQMAVIACKRQGTQVSPTSNDVAAAVRVPPGRSGGSGEVWHCGSQCQPATGYPPPGAPLTDNHGTVYPAGTAIPQRADFNSLDNPFFYSSNPAQDGYANTPAASLHFVVFTPTSDAFHRSRRAMDGQYPDGTNLGVDPRSFKMGFNAALKSTHRPKLPGSPASPPVNATRRIPITVLLEAQHHRATKVGIEAPMDA